MKQTNLVVLTILTIFTVCVNSDHLWHPYRLNLKHQIREELIITNVTSDHQFNLKVNVTKWKSLSNRRTATVAGLMGTKVVVATIKNREEIVERYVDCKFKVVDVALFEHWNTTLKMSHIFIVAATQKPELIWYRLEENGSIPYWHWPLNKTINHVNIFEIEHKHHLMVISTYLSQTTADLYQFDLKSHPNFWLNQALDLADVADVSAAANYRADSFLAIPQKNLRSLLIYKRQDCHFVPYENITSYGVDQVVTFEMGSKMFLALNGYDGGIYKFTKTGLVKEDVNFPLDGVQYWLPIPVNTYREEVALLAQRSLSHGHHHSFVVEIYTYDGVKFDKHDDVDCSYFGDVRTGLSCLSGEEDSKGMVGSCAIVLDNYVSLLVPRADAHSELFILNTTIKKVASPRQAQVDQILKTRNYLEELIASVKREYESLPKPAKLNKTKNGEPILAAALHSSDLSFDDLKSQVSDLDKKIKQLEEQMKPESNGKKHYSKIYFNNIVEIQGPAVFKEVNTHKIGGQQANQLLQDIASRDHLERFTTVKNFDRLEVDDLKVHSINDLNAQNLVFKSAEGVQFDGTLILTKPLEVAGNLTCDEANGLVLQDEVVQLQEPITVPLNFDSVEVFDFTTTKLNEVPIHHNKSPNALLDNIGWNNSLFESLFIEDSIQVGFINGEDFNQFLDELCLKNLERDIPGRFKVLGNITVDVADVDYLNGLKFPQEFVFISDSSANITGRKVFDNLLSNEVSCAGLINGLDSSQIITLSSDQNITGKPTFTNLEVMEGFNVGGRIITQHAQRFLPNPTLQNSSLIQSKANFKNLEIKGKVILTKTLNGKDLETLLDDVVYKDDKEAVIHSAKEFLQGITVKNGLQISSNSVNNIDLASLVRKDVGQKMMFNTINGLVFFANIHTAGLYDTVNVTKLDQEVVKLSGEQYISSTLIFDDDLDTKSFEIMQTVNNKTLEDYESAFSNKKISGSIEMDEIDCDMVEIGGDLTGQIENFDLEEFDKKKLSLTKDQTITGQFTINNTTVTELKAMKLNDMYFMELVDEALLRKKLKYNLETGQIAVQNLHINGSLKIHKINGTDGLNLAGAFWMNAIKDMKNLTIVNDVLLSNLTIDKLGGINFNKFLSSIVFKDDPNPVFSSSKLFLGGLAVDKFIETDQINNIDLSNILRGHGRQELSGPLVVEGNVTFGDTVTVADTVNGIPLKWILDVYQSVNNTPRIKGDVLFNRLVHIRSLQINGSLAGKPVQELLDAIIFKDSDFELSRNTIFKNSVHIAGNLRVLEKINNIHLPAFVSNMVMTTKDSEISGPVRFTQSVSVQKKLHLGGNLKTGLLNSVNLQNWLDDGVFVDRGLLQSHFTFEAAEIVDKLITQFVNDVDFNSLIPLRTDQNLTELKIEEVTSFGNITVGGLVNGRYLPVEHNRTLMTDSVQHISTSTSFAGSVFVENRAEISTINNLSLHKLVTTNTPQNLTALYNFNTKTNLDRDLNVAGLTDGIDVNQWFKNAIKISSPFNQTIQDKWIVNNLTFSSDITGHGLINGMDLAAFKNQVDDKRNFKYLVEKRFIDEYSDMCLDLSYLYNNMRDQIYKFDYFEKLQLLTFGNNVNYAFTFQHGGHNYLIVNEHNTCMSYLLMFVSYRYVHLNRVKMGQIQQIVSVLRGDNIFLVVRNSPRCGIEDTNVWQFFDNGDLVRIQVTDDQDLLQDSLIPGAFYGIQGGQIFEYRLSKSEPLLRKYRKWMVSEDNMAFVPRGLGTGVAIRTGTKIVTLHRDDLPEEEDFGYEMEVMAIANFTAAANNILPGRNGSDLAIIKVGKKSTQRKLLAVASHEDNGIMGGLDFIKIYEGNIKGILLQKIPSYKPSSLVSLEFGNGETLLVFLEDNNSLQAYEYKGIEGFKHRLSAKLVGSKLFAVTLPFNAYPNERKVVGFVNKNEINFMEAVMLGNQIQDDFKCAL